MKNINLYQCSVYTPTTGLITYPYRKKLKFDPNWLDHYHKYNDPEPPMWGKPKAIQWLDYEEYLK